MKKEELGINVKKNDDFSEWYNEVVIKGELADHSLIKGFMIIKPSGYSIWEKIQTYFYNIDYDFLPSVEKLRN